MTKTKVSRYKYKWGGIAGRVLGTGIGALAGNPMLGMQIGGMAGDAVDGATAATPEEQVSIESKYAPASYRNGGAMPVTQPMKNGAKKYVGPKHEQGGIPIDSAGNPSNANTATAEVEGGETEQDGYIFSDTLKVPNSNLTFAEMHEKMVSANAPKEKIQLLMSMQERAQEEAGVQGGDEMGPSKQYQFGGVTLPEKTLNTKRVDMPKNALGKDKSVTDFMFEQPTNINPNAPNKNLIAAKRLLPSLTRVGMAAFAPRNDEKTANVRAGTVPVTSPVFNKAKQDLKTGYTTLTSNPNMTSGQKLAAQAQYQRGVSDVAGKESDYRLRTQTGNVDRNMRAQAMNAQLSQGDREAKAQETGARMKMISEAVEMPLTMYRADEANKRKAITDIMVSADQIANPRDRMKTIKAKLTALGLPKSEIDSIIKAYIH